MYSKMIKLISVALMLVISILPVMGSFNPGEQVQLIKTITIDKKIEGMKGKQKFKKGRIVTYKFKAGENHSILILGNTDVTVPNNRFRKLTYTCNSKRCGRTRTAKEILFKGNNRCTTGWEPMDQTSIKWSPKDRFPKGTKVRICTLEDLTSRKLAPEYNPDVVEKINKLKEIAERQTKHKDFEQGMKVQIIGEDKFAGKEGIIHQQNQDNKKWQVELTDTVMVRGKPRRQFEIPAEDLRVVPQRPPLAKGRVGDALNGTYGQIGEVIEVLGKTICNKCHAKEEDGHKKKKCKGKFGSHKFFKGTGHKRGWIVKLDNVEEGSNMLMVPVGYLEAMYKCNGTFVETKLRRRLQADEIFRNPRKCDSPVLLRLLKNVIEANHRHQSSQ